jgi:hypothetical protein
MSTTRYTGIITRMLTNLEEYQSNTNPFHTDTDEEVLNDGEELGRGMKPLISDSDDETRLHDEEVRSELIPWRLILASSLG